LLRPPKPSATFVRRLRAGGVGLLGLLTWAVVAPGFVPGGALATGGPAGLVAVTGQGGEPSPAEWARLRTEAFQRGREAAAGAERDRAAARAAAGGAGATATPISRVVPAGGDRAIPAMALRAYREAAAWAAGFAPGCHLDWTVLAGIGRIESNHGMFGGPATRFSPAGTVSPRITGPPLDGRGVARIADSDGGRWDGDTTWDRAVGPMQFIPTTWRSLGRDGNGDRVADPNNLFDAAVSAAGYLCLSGHGDLRDPARLRRAVFAYNHSWAYVDTVLGWARLYRGGVAAAPGAPTGVAAPGPPAGPPAAAAAPTASTAAATTRAPDTTAAAATTRRPTTTDEPATTAGPTTTRRPTSTTARPTTTTTLPPTTGSSTTTTTTTTRPCQTTTTTTTTTGDPSTTTSTTTTTTLPGGSTTTTTTLPPCE
jgi:transglycosylase-like protein with SLT domain